MSTIVSSEESRKEYSDRKKQVLNLLKNAIYTYQKYGSDKAPVFEKLYEDLEKGDFSIVVVGEFSAGKSTLLNALMGKRILPSYSNETTATVNFLRHIDRSTNGEAGKVFYNDDSTEVIEEATLEVINKYVSTQGDDVVNRVNHLDLYLDSDFLCDGVTLVDSPGLNGVADGHREITEAQILKSHACIFLFNSDHPGSKTDFEFLHDLHKRVNTIIFVLNKIDEIKEDENETPEIVIDSLKKTYKEKFPEDNSIPEIWPVAAYPALVARNPEPLVYHEIVNRTNEEKKELEKNSRLKEFENRLMLFLTCGEKTKQQLISPVDKVINISLDNRKLLEEEKNILEQSSDSTELQNQISCIQEASREIENKILDSRNEISRSIRESIRDVLEELAAQMSRLQDRKIDEIDDFEDFDDLFSYLQQFENNFINKVYSIALSQEENLRDRVIGIIKSQYSTHACDIESELLKHNTEISLSANEHLDTNERVFEVGLKDMNEKEKILKDQLKELITEMESAEDDYYKARKNERLIGEIKNELSYLKDRKDMVESQILPPVERYEKTTEDQEWRGGLLGIIGNILFGKKNVTNTSMVVDHSLRDSAMEEKNRQIDKIDNEINEKKNELNSFDDVDSSMAERNHIRKMAEVDEMRKQLEELLKQNTKKIESKYSKEIKKLKRELVEYCDGLTDELNRQVKKALRNSEQEYIDIVVDIIVASLKASLDENKMRIEQIEQQLNSSIADRNLRISEINNQIIDFNELLEKASELKIDLDAIEVNYIRQEAI